MDDQKPLVNASYLLEKYPGKGGWTYAEIPEVLQNKNNPFGWVKVRGSVDDFEFNHYRLMPMGEGKLFLPVKAEIRKKIGKEAGDSVNIVLYADDSKLEIPQEIVECFDNESPELYKTYLSFSEAAQKAYLDWFYEAKTDETKARRILTMMDRLKDKLTLYDKMDKD